MFAVYGITHDHYVMLVHAVECLGPESHVSFTSKHLALVLGRCFKANELENFKITEEKEKAGQTVQAERTVKGLVPRCLEKDEVAFSSLSRTKAKPKGARLSLLSECRPEGCSSAVDLLLWLVEVRE